MIGHRMDYGKNEACKLCCAFIEVPPHVILHIRTILVKGCDTYNLDINLLEIKSIINCIF